MNEVKNFINWINNIKQTITYFRDKIHKSKKKYKKYKRLATILKSVDTIVSNATTSSSIALSLTGIALIVIPAPNSIACALSIANKVIYEIVMQKYNKYKEQYQKDQQTIKYFDNIYRKSLQDNVIDKIEYEFLRNFFTKYLHRTKNEYVLKIWKWKIYMFFFSIIKLNFNLEHRTVLFIMICSV